RAAIAARRMEILAVGGLFVVTGAYLAIQAARVKGYVWMIDELLYTKAAQGFAQGSLHSQLFGIHQAIPNPLYAWLLAIPYGLIGSLNAFKAAHVLDALLFAAAVVPVYATARLLGATRVYALLAAALA